MRKVSAAGIALIKSFEGFSLKAYRSPAGDWTIGIGHTAGVAEGEVITNEQAETLLADDLRLFCSGIERLVTVPLNDNQFAALVSFTFNIGLAAFARSTLLSLLNRGWYEQVPAQLLRWSSAAGKRLSGLARRRRAEAVLWSTPV
jgi:lysozyme